MIKKSIIFIVLVLFNFNIYSINNFFYDRQFLVDRFQHIEIKGDNFKYYENGPDGYKIFVDGKFTLTSKNKFTLLNVKEKKYIAFFLLDTIILYDIDNNKRILGTDYAKGGFSTSLEPNLFTFKNFDATSFLTEGKVKFEPSNLENFDLTTPWVEGDKGNGINSRISFELGTLYPTNNIVLVNGFFNPQKLFLYDFNNRIKKIKIKCLDNPFEVIEELEDSPNLQMIKLPKDGKKFEIEIIEIYKGAKYSDTCLSGLFTNFYLAYPKD